MCTRTRSPRAFIIAAAACLVVAGSDNLAHSQCPTPPPLPNGVIETIVEIDAQDAAVAVDPLNRAIVGWISKPMGIGVNEAYVKRFFANGACICGPLDECPALITTGAQGALYQHVSVAMIYVPTPTVGVAWIGGYQPLGDPSDIHYLGLTFPFDELPFSPPKKSPPECAEICPGDSDPSAGMSDPRTVAAWVNQSRTPDGLGYTLDIEIPAPNQVRALDQGVSNRWQPCVSARPDGYYLVAFANGIPPDFFEFQIRVGLYDLAGNPINEAVASQPVISDGANEMLSPAVSFVGNDVCVTWSGPRPDGCTTGGLFRIYARHTTWAGPGNPLTFDSASPQFIVNTDPSWTEFTADNSNPTVSLNPAGTRELIVAWNGKTQFDHQIRARYFQIVDDRPQPLSGEFRVNQSPAEPDLVRRELSQSAQHTVASRADGAVAVTWTDFNQPSVYLTILPDGFAQTLCREIVCLKGDCDGNGFVNGLDIQVFVHALLGGLSGGQCDFEIGVDPEVLCPFDCNCDCLLTFDDIDWFVTNLLGVTSGCPPMPFTEGDCNNNGRDDITDIHSGASQDCNRNYVPDECDIASDYSPDLNADGIPDECQPDCNNNDVPDDRDILLSTSLDINDNDVPDECDPDCDDDGQPDDYEIAVNGAPDCNLNGIPDGCEQDCNENGVPDDCDVDPTDPDGDLWVSPDCNGNEWPDECDIAAGPFFSSADVNENGIPDECEESLMGGGGAPAAPGTPDGGEPMTPEELDAAWEDFFEWYNEQVWGPASEFSGLQQYQRYLDKLTELGLTWPTFP